MANNINYGMDPNPQYTSGGAPGGEYGFGTGQRYRAGYQNGGMYNMPTDSPYAPTNQGGPGNPNGASNMAKPMLPRFNPAFQNNKGMAPLTPFDRQVQGQGGYPGTGINPNGMYGQGGPMQDRWYNGRGGNNRPPMDPYQQYGNAGQSQSLGRYRPPMMSDPYNPGGGWLDQGQPYGYNIPNSYGSGQWNQFNSTDTASRNFGQTQNQLVLGVNQSVRQGQPQYQSPFAAGDPSRSQNLLAYMQGIAQPQQKPQYTQPGAPASTPSGV